MTDEELGRAWAGAAGKRPYETEAGLFGWQGDRWNSSSPFVVPDPLWVAVPTHFESEAEAYAKVGSLLRQVFLLADFARAALSGFDAGSPGARQDFKEWVAATIDGYIPQFKARTDQDDLDEQCGIVADQIVDMAYSHFRFEGDK